MVVDVAGGAREEIEIQDTPYFGIARSAAYIEVNDNFADFLMYKPSGADSIWVPIRKFRWGWEANAFNVGTSEAPNWQPGIGKKDDPVQGPTTQLPEWDARIQDILKPENFEPEP